MSRCTCSECEVERHEPPEPETHEVRFRRHDIRVSKDTPESNWYVVVTAPSGLRAYDGWWLDSAGKSWQEAVAEAKDGACLATHGITRPNTNRKIRCDLQRHSIQTPCSSTARA